MKKNQTIKLCICALLTALTAVCAQIAIPIPHIPITLSTLAVYVAGGLLGWKYGTISQIVYVLLGLIGLPVFSGFSGGPAVTFGQTGGYIIGFIFCALIIGLMTEKINKVPFKVMLPVAMVIGTLVLYVFGTAWFMIMTGTALWQSLLWCVFPFLIGDAIKIVLSTVLVMALKPVLEKKKILSYEN